MRTIAEFKETRSLFDEYEESVAELKRLGAMFNISVSFQGYQGRQYSENSDILKVVKKAVIEMQHDKCWSLANDLKSAPHGLDMSGEITALKMVRDMGIRRTHDEKA